MMDSSAHDTGAPSEGPDTPDPALGADLEAALVEGLADPEPEPSDDPDPAAFADGPESEAASTGTAAGPGAASEPGRGDALGEAFTGAARPDEPEAVPALGADLEAALVEGLADPEPEPCENPNPSTFPDGPDSEAAPPEAVAAAVPPEGLDTPPSDLGAGIEAGLVEGLAPEPSEGPGLSVPPGDPDLEGAAAESVLEDAAGDVDVEVRPEYSEGPVAALAFATDHDTEIALREGLRDHEAPPGHEEPQVWPGGLRAAIATLADGYSTRLILVDVDGIPYPAGALHDLAAVCEVDTVVIAIGADATAQASRRLLLAGVSDYLVKPVSAAGVREAVARATAPAAALPRGGSVVGFAGAGGSGTTTVAAATALHAAARGRYVSVLDLNRTVSPMALMLDVQPSPGLDQLLDAADRSAPDPQVIDAVAAARSDRIAVYAYRSGPAPPPAPGKAAVDWLLAALRERSQLVVVDGVDDPWLRLDLLAAVDTRVLVVEPTPRDAARADRLLGLLGASPPVVLVCNRTRAFARALPDARVAARADVLVPFEASLPQIADEGWRGSRLPRSLRKPVAALAEQILAPVAAADTGRTEPSRGS